LTFLLIELCRRFEDYFRLAGDPGISQGCGRFAQVTITP
jgi:hypothetical protein